MENTALRHSFWRKAKAYFALTKPRVIELLLIATVPTMILAERGIPDPWLVIATVLGGAMSAGSANSFNCYIDRDIDKIMGRTKSRPLVTGELSAKEAYIFAWLLGAGSVAWLGLLVNWLAAALSLAAILFYVLLRLGLRFTGCRERSKVDHATGIKTARLITHVQLPILKKLGRRNFDDQGITLTAATA